MATPSPDLIADQRIQEQGRKALQTEPLEREVTANVRFDPVVFHAAKSLVDEAFVGMPGLAAAYVREVFTMIEHDASNQFGRAFVESWTEMTAPTSALG